MKGSNGLLAAIAIGIWLIAAQLIFGGPHDKYVYVTGNFKNATRIMVALDSCQKRHDYVGVIYECEERQ